MDDFHWYFIESYDNPDQVLTLSDSRLFLSKRQDLKSQIFHYSEGILTSNENKRLVIEGHKRFYFDGCRLLSKDLRKCFRVVDKSIQLHVRCSPMQESEMFILVPLYSKFRSSGYKRPSTSNKKQKYYIRHKLKGHFITISDELEIAYYSTRKKSVEEFMKLPVLCEWIFHKGTFVNVGKNLAITLHGDRFTLCEPIPEFHKDQLWIFDGGKIATREGDKFIRLSKEEDSKLFQIIPVEKKKKEIKELERIVKKIEKKVEEEFELLDKDDINQLNFSLRGVISELGKKKDESQRKEKLLLRITMTFAKIGEIKSRSEEIRRKLNNMYERALLGLMVDNVRYGTIREKKAMMEKSERLCLELDNVGVLNPSLRKMRKEVLSYVQSIQKQLDEMIKS